MRNKNISLSLHIYIAAWRYRSAEQFKTNKRWRRNVHLLTIQKRYDMENDDNRFSSWIIKIERQDESGPVNLGRLNISTNVLPSQEKTCAKYTAIQIFRILGILFVLIPVGGV